MDLFRSIAMAGVGGTVVAVALHYLAFGRRRAASTEEPARPRMGRWGRWAYGVTAIGFLVLTVTGFWPAVCGDRLSGWLLMVHCAAAPVFAAGLVAVAFVWAERCRFARDGRPGPQRPVACRVGTVGECRKIVFWVAAALGVSLILTTMLSMVEVFGTPGQEVLFEVHRYSAVLMVMTAVVHLYLAALSRAGSSVQGGRRVRL